MQSRQDDDDRDRPLSLSSFVHLREHHDGKYIEEVCSILTWICIAGQTFHLENPRMMAVKVDGHIWMKRGTMAAYTGDIKFRREGIAENGLGKMILRKATKENIFLNKVIKRSHLFF